jgi:membrane-bound inhibitor of C-type lysozyme
MRSIPAVLVVACLAACATPSAGPAPVVYTCDDGTSLTVRFAPEVAYVSTGTGAELALPQQRAASGIWYATPQHTLRGKGDEATWTVGRRAPAQCRVQR